MIGFRSMLGPSLLVLGMATNVLDHRASAASLESPVANVSNPAADVPGGENSAAGVATKLSATAQAIGTPGNITLTPGVAITATYIGEAATNPLGGLKQGTAYAGQLFGGVDLDLARIAGIDGAYEEFELIPDAIDEMADPERDCAALSSLLSCSPIALV